MAPLDAAANHGLGEPALLYYSPLYYLATGALRLATGNTWAMVTVLASHAGRVVVANPAKTRAIAEAKVKTDKVDAAILAQLLAADYLPAVWLPDEASLDIAEAHTDLSGETDAAAV